MDVTKKVLDLMKLALDARTPPKEAENAAFGALRLIEEFKLLATKKRVDVAADVVDKIIAMTNPIFAEEVASRAEKIVDSFDRVAGAFGRLADKFAPRAPAERSGGRKRKYGSKR